MCDKDKICKQCSTSIAGDSCICPCGVFYHPGCIALASSQNTGARRCCGHKPRSSSPIYRTASNSPVDGPVTKSDLEKILNSYMTKTSTLLENHHASMSSEISNFKDTVSSKLDVLGSQLSSTMERIDNLEIKVQELENKPQIHDSYSQCMEELSDRIARKKNLILFGCPEANRPPDASPVTPKLIDVVNVFLSKFMSNHSYDCIKVFRIGKFPQHSGPPRPVRIIFESDLLAQKILKEYWKWREANPEQRLPGHMSLAPDNTQAQRVQYSEMKKLLREHIARGEQHLKLVTRHGIAKIISTKPRPPVISINPKTSTN